MGLRKIPTIRKREEGYIISNLSGGCKVRIFAKGRRDEIFLLLESRYGYSHLLRGSQEKLTQCTIEEVSHNGSDWEISFTHGTIRGILSTLENSNSPVHLKTHSTGSTKLERLPFTLSKN